jgi:Domain of unknown function (DUF5050)/Thrombospondin type 3 repeat
MKTTKLILTLGAAFVCAFPTPSGAATVTTTADSGPGSLRDTIASASPGDTIDFSLPANSTITLTSGELLVDKNLTISGPGANTLAVDGNASSRVFHISPGKTVTISGLTIQNGLACCVFPDNFGGGIYNDQATLTVSNCTFSGNSANYGGGIDSVGVLTVSNSTFSGNSAGSGGGGIDNAGTFASATLTVSNSTFSGNTVPGTGGTGGGILNTNGGATQVSNCTFSGNSAKYAGGNLMNYAASATLTIGNTILNAGVPQNIYNADATVTSLGYNLSSDGGVTNDPFIPGSTGSLNATGDQINKEPKLGSLADNGGPTKTHALLPGSPAIDKGNNPDALTTDQRGPGFARTFNDPAISNAGDGTDSGAYEYKDTDGDGVEDFRDNCPSTPNPEKIAFTSFRDGNFEVYVMNADGSNPTNLTNNAARDLAPSFSPDGSRIVFASGRDGNDEIYVMNADGSNPSRLTNNAATDTQPSFSPDGSRIVFASLRDGNAQIYVMNADGSNPTNLTNNAATDTQPSFSPDGSRIVFTSLRDNNFEIYVMNADGTGQANLSNNAATDQQPSFSPDGSRIVFTSTRDDNSEIYVMDANGSNQTRLTNNAAFDANPSFSPDGSRIAFQSDRDGNSEIYVMNVDGSNQTRLTNNPANDLEPSWGAQADSDHDGIGDACECPPPTITLNNGGASVVKPNVNHSYKTFRVSDMVQGATSDCDGTITNNVVIEKATSDEVENTPGPGDGNTLKDIVIAADCKSVKLRAERDGTKDGRVYLVTLRVSDSSGNVKRAVYKVSVPVGKGSAIDSGVHYTVTSSCPL